MEERVRELEHADPFLQGLAAGSLGLAATQCPFELYSVDEEHWLEGWAMAGSRKNDTDAPTG